MKILLVEDDPFMNELYTDILREAKLSVETVKDGNAAYSKMHEGGYDLVLLDMFLPEMSGLEVLEKLKQNPPEKLNKKVVFLTNTDNLEDIKKIKNLSEGYLLKSSLTPDEFLAKVKSYLGHI